MKIAEAVAKRTKELLQEKNMSQYRLEKNMTIPHGTMIDIMSAKNNSVNLRTALQIAKGLGITAGEFFTSPYFENEDLDID